MGLRLTRGLTRGFRNASAALFEDFTGGTLSWYRGLVGINEDAIYLTGQGQLLANYVLAHFV